MFEHFSHLDQRETFQFTALCFVAFLTWSDQNVAVVQGWKEAVDIVPALRRAAATGIDNYPFGTGYPKIRQRWCRQPHRPQNVGCCVTLEGEWWRVGNVS